MRIHVFVLFILFINSFGLQAQNRDSSPLDCTKEEFIFARTITYTNLEAQKEYMLLFPHHEYLESSVDNLLSEQHAKNVYWKKNKLYFTATQEFVYFDYPGITKDLQVINCSDFYISPKSFAPMDEGIETETGQDIADLIDFDLLGDVCVNATNINGPNNANGYGIFTSGLSSIGIDEGIVLATGNINAAEGPNTGGSSSVTGPSDGADPDLAALIGNSLNDVVKIEFDFVPDEDKISFDYVFASEEYCFYVNSAFNDVFGFFISGPGINGPFTGGAENIALIPGTTDYVSINNINWDNNGALYNTNAVGQTGGGCVNDEISAPKPVSQLFGFNGFTEVLTAEADVIPCETYHIKIVLADVGDSAFDSGIFLAQNSFISGDINARVNVNAGSLDGDGTAEEGCETAYISFNIDPPIEEITFNLQVLGTSTATQGIDFDVLPPTYTVPLGVEFDTLWIDVFSDAILEGLENVDIQIVGICGCLDPIISFEINDPPFYEQQVVLCEGETLITSQGEYSEPGQYYNIVETPGECDSLILLDLSFNAIPIYDTVIYRCFTETLDYLGETFLFAPDYREITLEGASFQGCDSIVQVFFEWINPDLILEADNVFSCTDTIVNIYVKNNPLPSHITYYEWVTPTLDTISADTLQATIPGTYQILSYSELEDRTCSNFFPNDIIIEADASSPIIAPLDDISVFCETNIPEVTAIVDNMNDLGNINFTWVLPDNSTVNGESITPSIVGTYTIQATNLDNDCTTENSFEYSSEDIIPNIEIFHDGIGCDATAVILNSIVDIPGGTFSWVGPNGFTSEEQNPSTNILGDYTLEYSLSPSCMNSQSTILIGNDSIPDLIAQGDTIICSQGIGILNFESDTIQSFVWNGPNNFSSTDSFPEVIEEGTYSIEVLAFNGCTNAFFVDLMYIDIVPEITTKDSSITCENLSINLSAEVIANNPTFEWVGPNGFVSSELNPEISVNGTYTISVTNEEGCNESQSVQILIDTISPVFDITGAGLNCKVKEVNLTIETEDDITSYNWDGPAGYNSAESDILINESGNYIAEIISKNGCKTSKNYFVPIDTLAPLLTPINDTLDCNTGIAEIEVVLSNPTTNIEWFDPMNNSIENNLTSIEVQLDGIYTVIGIDTTNNCQTEIEIEVSPNTSSPDLELTGELITCEDKDFVINAISSFSNLTYNWTGPSGFTSSEQNPVIDFAGVYSLEIISDEDCITVNNIEINDNLTTPDIAVFNDTLNCAKLEATLELVDSNVENVYNWSLNNESFSNEMNPVIDEGGIYSVEVIGQNFCDTTAFIEITVDTSILPIEADVSNVLDCNNPTTAITINTPYSNSTVYEWNGGYYTDNGNSIETNEAGTYQLTVTTENGCTQEQVFDVLEDFDLIEINSPDSLINCYIPEINLSVNLSPSDFASIEWNGPSGFISSELEPQINEGGLYVLTVEGNNGCTNTTEVQINSDFAQPIIELNDGILSCNQTSVTITNEQDNDYFYLWESNGTDLSSETGKEIIALQAGTYFTTATNLDNGCETTSESIVEQLPDISNIEIETDNPDCFNPFGNIEITGIIGGTEPYAFSIDGGITYQSETVFTDLNSGEYSVVVQDFYECADSLDAEIVSLLDFELSANGPFVIFAGTSQQLIVETGIIPENIESITWSPNESLSCTDCLNPVSNTLEDVTYMVTVIDKDGCIYQAEIEIRILENPIYIPNVFTPNDDGENEYFSVFGDLEKIQNVNIFSIYDRWGERVFKTENVLATDESMKWYGNFKGQPALTGVYAYYIEYISITGELIKRTGDVTIIR